MADSLKEIYRGTLTYGNYSNNKQTVFTTNSTTQYVIKDVEISSTTYLAGAAPVLQVNSSTVCQLASTATGSCIIDTNSTIEITNTTEYNLFNILSMSTPSGTSLSMSSSSFESLPGLNNSVSTLSGINSIGNISFGIIHGATYVGSDFYFWGGSPDNTTNYLYKDIGGPGGTRSLLAIITSSDFAYDGVGLWYYVHDTNRYLYSINTSGTITQIAAYMGTPGTNQSAISYINGLIIWSNNGSNPVVIKTYDIAKGVLSTLTFSSARGSTNCFILAFYNASIITDNLRVWFVCNANTSYAYYCNMSWNPISGVVSLGSSNLITQKFLAGIMSGANLTSGCFSFSQSPSVSTKYRAIAGGSDRNTIYIVDNDLQLIASKSVIGGYFDAYASWIIPIISPTTEQKNTYGPTITMRITGIKSTI